MSWRTTWASSPPATPSSSGRGLDKEAEADVIGQFGVGFYSAFMVADHITVISRKYGEEQAYRWESDGLEGYTIEPLHP